jgi:hypothetical protein
MEPQYPQRNPRSRISQAIRAEITFEFTKKFIYNTAIEFKTLFLVCAVCIELIAIYNIEDVTSIADVESELKDMVEFLIIQSKERGLTNGECLSMLANIISSHADTVIALERQEPEQSGTLGGTIV